MTGETRHEKDLALPPCQPGHARARQGRAPIFPTIDNERVTVRDVPLEPDTPGPQHAGKA